MTEMKGHPDYELKQNQVLAAIKQFSTNVSSNENRKPQSEQFKSTIESLKKLSNNDLKNMTLEQLQKLLDDSIVLVEDLTQAVDELTDLNQGLVKERQNVGDADIYEILEKRGQDVSRAEVDITFIKSSVKELEDLFKQSKSTAGQLESSFSSIKS